MMKRLGLIAAGILLSAVPALAQSNRIPFNSGAAYSNRAASDGNCGVTLRESGNVGGSAYATRDCDASTDEGFVWYFRWLPSMPTTGTVAMDVEWASTSIAGAACWNVAIGCSNTSSGNDLLTMGTTTSDVCTTTSAGAVTYITTSFSAVALPATVAADRFCMVRVTRHASSASDTLSVDALVRGGALKF